LTGTRSPYSIPAVTVIVVFSLHLLRIGLTRSEKLVKRLKKTLVLATLVTEHQIDKAEAKKIATELAYGLVKQAYRL
jgi:hypothetical protein